MMLGDALLLWLILGLVGVAIALYRGLNAPVAFVGTLLLGPFGILGAMLVPRDADEEDDDACPRCGAALAGDERYCPSCGRRLT